VNAIWRIHERVGEGSMFSAKAKARNLVANTTGRGWSEPYSPPVAQLFTIAPKSLPRSSPENPTPKGGAHADGHRSLRLTQGLPPGPAHHPLLTAGLQGIGGPAALAASSPGGRPWLTNKPQAPLY